MCISQVFVRVKSFEEEIENTVITNYKWSSSLTALKFM